MTMATTTVRAISWPRLSFTGADIVDFPVSPEAGHPKQESISGERHA
jgi:hypothetical protein